MIFIDNPNQTDLVKLYKQALALVMPSKLEGWGMPAGEALWCGTPAICSTAEALQEVCGELGLYFEPDDAPHLASTIHHLMTDHEFDMELRNRIQNSKRKLRTWNMVAHETLQALKTSQ